MIIIAEVSELTRKVKLPTDRVISVDGDYQVDGIAFKLPTTYEGDFDFSSGVARVHWTGVDKVEHTNLLTDKDTSGRPLWIMPSELTQGGHGVIEFAISFVATDETAAITKRWISDPVSFRNRRTVNGSNEDEEAEEEVIYDRLASAIAAVRAAQAEVEDTNAVLSSLTGSAPVPVENRADMVDDGHLYLYTGDETGLVAGNLYYYVNGTLTNGGQYGSMEVDATLTQSGQAADAAVTGAEISAIKEDLSDLQSEIEGGSGLTADLKAALDQLAQKVAYIDADGQTYYDALHAALYPPANLTRISCVYTQSGTVYDSDALDSLKSDLVVTAHYNDGTAQTVTAYILSGTLAEGTSTIKVSYGGKTATFDVTVSSAPFTTEYIQGNVTLGTSVANRVTLLIKDFHLNANGADELRFSLASGYSAMGATIANGTVGTYGTNNTVYTSIISDTGFDKDESTIDAPANNKWVTSGKWSSKNTVGVTVGVVGSFIKKTDESELTPSDAQSAITLRLVEVS